MPYVSDGTGVIYCMTSPSGRKYIGQSWNFKQRQYYYKNPKTCQNQRKLYHALMKYGFDTFVVEILDYCHTQEQMDDSECYWIRFYDSINNGYNIREGGSKGLNSPETIEKIKAKRKLQKTTPKMIEALSKHWGQKHSPETIEKMKKSQKGHSVSQEQRENIRKTLTGYKHTDQARKNMSESQKGRACSEKSKHATRERNKIWVYTIIDSLDDLTYETDDLLNFCKKHSLKYTVLRSAMNDGRYYRKRWFVTRVRKTTVESQQCE